MSKDVKIEILYFKAKPDVALEFGLHGDYPLRLLSSCSNDLKSFFVQLKRAVSRSEIILIVGGYSVEDGLNSFLARSIGQKCVIPNYRKLGIITNEKHVIPENANPIYPKSRLFGGFILEHGPQTIISLVDNPKIRIDVVNDFIISYITEHHSVFNTLHEVNKAVVPEVDNSANSDITDLNIKKEQSLNTPQIYVEEVTETVSASYLISNIEELDDEFEIEKLEPEYKNYSAEKHKSHRTRRAVRWIAAILSVIIVALLIIGYFILPKTVQTQQTQVINYYAGLQDTYFSLSDDLSKAFTAVKAKDERFFTWLSIPEANINYPVLNVAGVQNNNLLTTLPDGTEDMRGSLFGSCETQVTNAEYSTVIYGNAQAGGLFERLSSDELEGKKITSVDSRFMGEWKIFASFKHSDAEDFDYSQTQFSDSVSFLEYLNKLSGFSKSCDNLNFYGNEMLIILVGINGDERYIVAAMLSSIKFLSNTTTSNISQTSSSGTPSGTSSGTDSDYSESYVDNGNDFLGYTPDIYLPPIPSTPSNSTTTGSTTTTSSNISSGTTTSTPSQSTESVGTSSEQTSATPSQSATESTTVSTTESTAQSTTVSTTESTAQSSTVSVAESSAVSSSTPSEPKPNIDPIYTWDVTLAVKSTGPDRKGEVIYGDAVTVIAYMIEIEMSPTIDPPEALIAQAVVAYNWVINNGGLCSVDDDGNVILPSKPPTNAMQEPTKQALQYANAAKGMVLTYNNTLAKTYCHDTSAGFTAAYQNIWGGGSYPYLQGVECPVDLNTKYDGVVTKYSSETIAKLIKEKLKIDVTSMPKSEWLKPIAYDSNNAYCITISIGGVNKNGTYLRDTLLTGKDIKSIKSSAYTIDYDEEKDEFIVTTKGWGHGVGLSQTGAKAYAKQGWTAEQILMHFFPGTTLVKN